MGCGHSKINIYPKKIRNKNASKKTVTPEKTDSEDEEAGETELDNSENLNDCDQKKTIKVKPFGGPLLAQMEISSSQEDFFKMLDEKIESGPDYNADSETEKAAEAARLRILLKDWEIASACSRSLPSTPSKRRAKVSNKISRSTDVTRLPPYQIPPNVIHQSYGINQVAYRQVPNYVAPQLSVSNTVPYSYLAGYSTALQYQTITPMYTSQPTYQPPPPRHPPNYGSPIKAYNTSSPKHIPYDTAQNYSNSSQKIQYRPPVNMPKDIYSNGELQYYNHHYQYQQQQQQQQQQQLQQLQQQQQHLHLQQHHQPQQQQQQQQFRQYKNVEEQQQILLQQNQGAVQYRLPNRNYQSSVTIPVVQQNSNDVRKQYELT